MDGFVALGSNLGDRGRHLRAGLAGLRRSAVRALKLSSVWETEPVETFEPRWFWNMAVKIDTDLDPLQLLEVLLAVERHCGRTRGRRNASRTLDLDLLTLGDVRLRSTRLQLPHPRMWERRFVLAPLAEIAPELCDPESGRTVVDLLSRLPNGAAVRKLGPLASC